MTSRTGTDAPRRAAGAARGFTLVEVLVAVVILFGGIVGVLRGYAAAVAALEAGEETLAAEGVLAEVLAAAREDADGGGAGPRAGETRVRAVRYRWECRVSAPAGREAGALREVAATAWRDGSARRIERVTRWRPGAG